MYFICLTPLEKTLKDQEKSGDSLKMQQLQEDIDRLKQSMFDLENYMQKSERGRRQTNAGAPAESGSAMEELRDKVMYNEIRTNDCEQKMSLLLKSRRPAKGAQKPSQDVDEHAGHSGLDLADIASLLDTLKEDLRKELVGKLELQVVDKGLRVWVREEIEILNEEIEREQKKVKDNSERIEGHQNRLNSDSELILALQNDVRKLYDSLKQKAEGDEIDSMNTLINELYERLQDYEKGG